MKQTINMKNLISSLTLAGAMALSASPAMAFVDKDHSSEGVLKSATKYTGTSMPARFVDYDHTPESINKSASAKSNWNSAGSCGFLDCDHVKMRPQS